MANGKNRPDRRAGGFTLIELLVVVAIIALLISILLPSLAAARSQAKGIKCAANARQVGQAVAIYLTQNNGVYPVSYIYASGPNGEYDLDNQPLDRAYGYLHWSWFLYGRGEVEEAAFTCPEFPNGGAPRTNPGPNAEDWEGGQVDQRGQTSPNSLEDHQAARVAFTANAAVMPRNKFTSQFSGGPRVNKLVPDNKVVSARRIILAAELNNNWVTSGIQSGGGVESKSHRPVNPFYHLSSGANEYLAAERTPGFMYGPQDDRKRYGLQPYNQIVEKAGLIDGSAGPETNVVGRHHPGGDELGGTCNFLYTDGSVDRKTILATMKQREWGDAYYSISGRNEVLPGD
jgi:prepilin-type N-terminal cleavage/methylation domain-containing protein/prepilin-type processing-associated H-X9-DG protein